MKNNFSEIAGCPFVEAGAISIEIATNRMDPETFRRNIIPEKWVSGNLNMDENTEALLAENQTFFTDSKRLVEHPTLGTIFV